MGTDRRAHTPRRVLVARSTCFMTTSHEAAVAHDVMSEVIGQFVRAFAVAWHGDADGRSRGARRLLEARAGILASLRTRHLVSSRVVACLADGDARRLGMRLAIEQGRDHHSRQWMANMRRIAQAALACGELAAARAAGPTMPSQRRMDPGCAVGAVRRAPVSASRRVTATQAALTPTSRSLSPRSTWRTSGHPRHAGMPRRSGRARRSHREAGRLLGAADAASDNASAWCASRFSTRLPSAGGQSCGNALGDDDFDAAWAEGAALSTEEAIAYALRGRGERKRPSTGWESLTPTELDVVRLVAEGIPNKDIATRLFVSPRTVQSHLRHVYNKLSLTSRVQLAQEAARRNGIPGRQLGAITTGNSIPRN